MADNTTLNAGTGGDVIATDDISGVKYQRVKLTLGADGVNGGDVSSSNALPVSDNGSSLTVDNGGTFAVQAAQSGTWNINNVSGTVSLPTGASTSAKQPALGIAGTASSDVITVQGITGMTALKVDGSAVTQPISGSVGLNAGSNAIGSITNTSFAATQATAANLNATVVGTGTFAVQAAQSGTWTLGANSGVDIGDVTINNASGASAVNIQDGGNSLTIDAPDGTPVPTKLGDGTNYLSVDTAHNDGESNTENHFDTAAKGMHYNGTTWDRMRGDTTGTNQQGNIAHNSADAGNPVKIGAKAIAHGTNPTAVTAANRTDLYANRAGILWTIGGHPNIITRTVYISDATGAQTDASIVGTIAAGTKVAVTQVAVTLDSATTATGGVAVKLGFGATSIPADSSTGANGILLDHKGIAAGSGVVLGNGSGLIGIGADGEELRLTCEDPVGGGLSVMFSYYTIES